MKGHTRSNRDWECPYCGVVDWNGENKLRHLAKHVPAIARMLSVNFILGIQVASASFEAVRSKGKDESLKQHRG